MRPHETNRRSRFQHRHHRLPGSLHRPLLLRPDRHPDLSRRSATTAPTPDDNEAAQALHRRPGGARVLADRQQLALATKHAERVPRARTASRSSPRSTRARLVRHLRTRGVMRGVLSGVAGDPPGTGRKGPRTCPSMAGLDLATRVSTKAPYDVDRACRSRARPPIRSAQPAAPRFHVVAYDFGIKRNILRRLVHVGLPRDRGAGRAPRPRMCWRSNPTASFSPTAPAIPSRSQFQAAQVRKLIGKTPIFGICLGHQIAGPGAAAARPTS